MTEAKAVYVAEDGKIASGTMHVDLGPPPSPPVPYYVFRPEENITVWELAEVLRHSLAWYRWNVEYINQLPESVRRHFDLQSGEEQP
jgi:hypothetical protein